MTSLGGPGLASQPTPSRFTAMMAATANLKTLREAILDLAGRGFRAQNAGKRLAQVTLDVDSLPIMPPPKGCRWWTIPLLRA
ncbi:hypothetical protein [Rhodovulum strictum]|uniref:Uncharacterized protein n=1 Tax=Rhodovulum strictum TaxID=58314 RepID=A0A844BPI6_9RHOB|nr:hypothetical protein [Rhodovulum strictum]MRH22892.1 hypothetical protein [Rhodovulum strictum]